MTARLERLQKYLAEAELSPEDNKLYIEDLKLSIDIFTRAAANKQEIVVMSGFSIDC